MDRVALVLCCWVGFWMGVGAFLGHLYATIFSGTLYGFGFAILSTLFWPWITPKFLDQWMDGR